MYVELLPNYLLLILLQTKDIIHMYVNTVAE